MTTPPPHGAFRAWLDRYAGAQGIEGHEQDHGVSDAENEDRADRDERTQSGEGPCKHRRPADTQEERERRRSEWPFRDEDIKRKPTDEGPDQPRFEPHRDRADHAEDQNRVRLRLPDSDVRSDRQFEQGRHHRADRSEEQGHRLGRFLGESAKGRAPGGTCA